jgi:hypothetical protein
MRIAEGPLLKRKMGHNVLDVEYHLVKGTLINSKAIG